MAEKGSREKNSTEISMKEFLDFLRTAYRVADTVEDTLSAEGLMEEVDWIKLKNSQLVKPRSSSSQLSNADVGN